MNKLIYIFGGFTLGAALSGGLTWYFTKEHYQKEAQEEISNMREHYRNLKAKKKLENEIENLKSEEEAKEKIQQTAKVDAVDPNTPSGTGNEYYKLISKIPQKPSLEELAKERLSKDEIEMAERESPRDDPPEENDDEIVGTELDEISEYLEQQGVYEPDEEDIKAHQNPNPNPYLISEEEYIEHEGSWVQNTITFYPSDDTLADTDEEIMAQDIVGQEALDILRNDEADAVYVRNEKLGMEYEVVASPRSYVQDVLGIHIPPILPNRTKKPKKYDDEEDEE